MRLVVLVFALAVLTGAAPAQDSDGGHIACSEIHYANQDLTARTLSAEDYALGLVSTVLRGEWNQGQSSAVVGPSAAATEAALACNAYLTDQPGATSIALPQITTGGDAGAFDNNFACSQFAVIMTLRSEEDRQDSLEALHEMLDVSRPEPAVQDQLEEVIAAVQQEDDELFAAHSDRLIAMCIASKSLEWRDVSP